MPFPRLLGPTAVMGGQGLTWEGRVNACLDFCPQGWGGRGRSSLFDLSGLWDLLQPLQALQGVRTSVPGAWGEPSTLQSSL